MRIRLGGVIACGLLMLPLLAAGQGVLATSETAVTSATSATPAAAVALSASSATLIAAPKPASEIPLSATQPAPASAATTPPPVPAPATPSLTPAAPSAERGVLLPFTGLESPKSGDTATALRVVLGLTFLALVPAMLICVTAFLRIIVVLSMLRHALGMQETPPNSALIGLALFLTLFTMAPVIERVNQEAFTPFMRGTISMESAYEKGIAPVREFMVRQTREQDIALMVELSHAKQPETIDDVSNVLLIPAFMLSELRAAFQIGFMIFLPFLLIDLIVSSVLMSLGMMMMPPVTVSLPLKILLFIIVDGWSLLLRALVGSFH